MNNEFKFYDFISLYNLILLNLSKKERNYTFAFYYLNNEFNIEIKDYFLLSILQVLHMFHELHNIPAK